MTNEDAKKMLKAKSECLIRETSGTDIDCNYKNCDECNLCYEQGNMGEQKEALELAIKALEQQPCEDCISREKAIRATYGFERYTGIDETPYEYAESVLKKLPSVQPTRPTGHWIWIAGVAGWGDIVTTVNGYRCSECCAFNADKDNYCPNCGADMRESEDKE